ncbi:uncharacterized protein HaLaN_14002, partial [Haematococcus lacustris]
MLLQWYNKKQHPPSVVMKKAEASKFKDTWEFQYGSDGLVYAHCKACPREDGNGRDVSNMSQTSRQHVCESQSGGASNKRRVEENNYGPETFYRTTQLEDLHREVKELTVKQLVKLLQDGFVICSDGWRYKFAGKGAPLVNFILLKPDGGVLFIKVVDVSGKRKDAVAIKDQHLEVLCVSRAGNHAWDATSPGGQARHAYFCGGFLGGPHPGRCQGLVAGDCEAIRTELADQQMKMHVRNVHSIRANNPTRFAGLLLMAKDMQVIMGAIVGMTTSVSWEQLRSSSVNATVFDRLT